MLFNLYQVLKENDISLKELQEIYQFNEMELVEKLRGNQEFNQIEIKKLMSLFPEYELSWLLCNQDIGRKR